MNHNYYDGSKGVTVDLMGSGKTWIVTRVEVNWHFRGRGYAREMMERVCSDADKEGAVLLLSVESDGTGLRDHDLVTFYASLGFHPLRSAGEDTSTMVREPKGDETFLGISERWLDDPTWLCPNGHVSKRFLSSEERGDLCLACQEPVRMCDPDTVEGHNLGPQS